MDPTRETTDATAPAPMPTFEAGSGVERIEAEGDGRRWPSWDGLADDRGPIPTFGPVRADGRGRLVMDDLEREARRDAAIRALTVIGDITDETDTDELWEEGSRRFEGVR